MAESRKKTPIAADETADVTAEVSVAVPAEAPVETDAEDAKPERVQAEIEETLTRTKVISRLKAIVVELEGGSLVVDGVPVDELMDPVRFELEYSAKPGKRELEIELKW